MTEKTTIEQPGFAQFGVAFQEGLMQALLTDSKWAQQMMEVIRLEYFDRKYLQFLARRFFEYYAQYKCFPSLKVLIMTVKDELRVGNDIVLRDRVIDYIKRIRSNPNPGDLPYVKERALDFCRRQAMKEALERSIDLIDDGQYESVVGTMRKALMIGTAPSIGHDFFEELDARLTPISRDCVATGIDELDDRLIMQGGLGKGELGVIAANTGVGKSHLLVQLGANAIRQGKNVVHYTFELSEKYVGLRYDSNLCDIPSNDCIVSKSKIRLKYEGMEGLGRLFVKSYPSNSCSVMTMRNHLEKLEVTKGARPDIVIVDYADIMRSTRSFDSLRHELKLIYEELRGLGQDLELPIWTASQAHRDSAKSEIVGLENMSEAYAKAMVADFVLSLSRKPLEKSTDMCRLFLAKNRFGKDGIVWPARIDTSRSIVEITDEDSRSLEDERSIDERTLKNSLKRKWQRVKENDDLELRSAE